MIEPGKKIEEIAEFAPIVEIVDNPLKADIVAFFYDNPEKDDDAPGIAGGLGADQIKSVAGALEDLKGAGLLQTKIEGVMRSEYYHFTPSPRMRSALELIFKKAGTRDYWQEFKEYLRSIEEKKRRTRRLILIMIAVLVVAGLGTAGYLVSQKIKEQKRAQRLEALSGVTGTHEAQYPNGQLKSRVQYFSGDRNGPFTTWFENGQKMAEGEYRNNLPSGKWTFWDHSGNKIKVTTYVEGVAVPE